MTKIFVKESNTMSMDVRQFKTGFVTVTAFASIAAALASRRDNSPGSAFNEWSHGDGFVEINTGYGEHIDVYLTNSQGTGAGTVYRVRLQHLST